MEYYISHHGIKGQRWGIRRYQNEDGTLTEAGKKRYIVDDGTERLNEKGSKIYKKARDKAYKHLRSDEGQAKIDKYYSKIESASEVYQKAKTKVDKYFYEDGGSIRSNKGIKLNAKAVSAKNKYAKEIDRLIDDMSKNQKLYDIRFDGNGTSIYQQEAAKFIKEKYGINVTFTK